MPLWMKLDYFAWSPRARFQTLKPIFDDFQAYIGWYCCNFTFDIRTKFYTKFWIISELNFSIAYFSAKSHDFLLILYKISRCFIILPFGSFNWSTIWWQYDDPRLVILGYTKSIAYSAKAASITALVDSIECIIDKIPAEIWSKNWLQIGPLE